MRICLTGPQGIGKSTIANAIAKKTEARVISFADPIYEMISILEGVDVRDLHKNEILKCTRLTLRDSLKFLGMGLRKRNADIFIDIAHRRLVEHVVIDDLRMQNEYMWCKDNGFTVINIVPGQDLDIIDVDTHVTEVERRKLEWDSQVTRSKDVSISDLADAVIYSKKISDEF